jgi:hypothetical protein
LVERITLENHRKSPLGRFDVVDRLSVNQKVAGRDCLETAKSCRFLHQHLQSFQPNSHSNRPRIRMT